MIALYSCEVQVVIGIGIGIGYPYTNFGIFCFFYRTYSRNIIVRIQSCPCLSVINTVFNSTVFGNCVFVNFDNWMRLSIIFTCVVSDCRGKCTRFNIKFPVIVC